MGYNLSACVFIRDSIKGAFALFESMAMLLPFADEFVVMDLGSSDGTLEALQQITASNPKVKLVQGRFPYTDAGAFATLANDLVGMCRNDAVLYYQADEVWHEGLWPLMHKAFGESRFYWSFWRIQYRDNFQRVKWFPQPVHRVSTKDRFNFVGDGMSTDRTFDAPFLSDYGGDYFYRWGEMGQEGVKPYVHQMVTDISLVGAFRENIPDRRAMHAPFWHETPHIEGLPTDQWLARERQNPNWTRPESPYDIPAILKYHVGKVRYELRPDLLEALKADTTEAYVTALVEGWR